MIYLFEQLSSEDQHKVRHVRRSIDMWMGGSTFECLRIVLDRLPNLRPAEDEAPEMAPGRQFGHIYDKLPVRF